MTATTATKTNGTHPAVGPVGMPGVRIESLMNAVGDAMTTYRNAVIEAAQSGVAPDTAELTMLLQLAHRSMPQFLADIARLKERLKISAEIEALEVRRPELVAAEEVEATERRKLNEIKRENEEREKAQERVRASAGNAAAVLRSAIIDGIDHRTRQLITTASKEVQSEIDANLAWQERLRAKQVEPESDNAYAVRVDRAERAAREKFREHSDIKGREDYRDALERTVRQARTLERGKIIQEIEQLLIDAENDRKAIQLKKYDPTNFALT